jgi:hypothetical protein
MLRTRAIAIEDVPLLRRMIVEFATFERLADQVTITEERLARDIVGSSPRFRGLLPEWGGQVAGYAIYFNFYSSFEGPACLSKTSTCARNSVARELEKR